MSEQKVNDKDYAVPEMKEQERMVEAILFAVQEPISLIELELRMPKGIDLKELLLNLQRKYETRGVNVVRVGTKWALRTAKDLGFLMAKESFETKKLSRAATETLAIVAYHQPVTRIEIEAISGVSVSRGTIDQLVELNWVKFGRRRMSPGRPVTYVITDTFLDFFGLERVNDLPDLKELRATGLLDNKLPPSEMDEKVTTLDTVGEEPEFFDE
jgi:segregation and condensation protein B